MIGLTRATAERIRRGLDRSPGNAQEVGTGRWRGHRAFIVRCTSATSASTSGVGAQCYPGVIVDLDPAETEQADLGEVWLTVYDAAGIAEKPKEGKEYLCLVQGDVEADEDDTRPRAFAVLGGGVSDPACKSFLALPECATLEVTEAYGACACITTGQTASLTRSGDALASDDLLYGCPPGVTTATGCDDNEAASKFSFTIPTQTGACAGAGGGWTVTYSALNTWTATRGDFTATLTKGLSSCELQITDGNDNSMLFVGEIDCCTGGTLDLDNSTGDCSGPATLTLTPATACGNGPAYTPYLSLETDTCGDCLKLLWIPVAGSGAASIRWKIVGCGVDGNGKPYAEFASASPLICTDDAEECGENYVVVRVTCDLCANADYTGPGYYCVDGECTYLDSGPGNGVVISAGRFATAEECSCDPDELLAECLAECDPGTLPSAVCVQFVFRTGTGSDTLGIDGVTVPLEFYYTVDPDTGSGNYGYRWNGAYSVNDVDECTAVVMSNVQFGANITSGSPGCGMLLAAPPSLSALALFGQTACIGVQIDVACGSETTNADEAFNGNLCAFRDAMTANKSMGAVLTTTSDDLGFVDGCYDIIITNTTCGLSPPQATYNCVNGTCVEVYDGSGEFATEAECTTACTGGGGGGGGGACCGVDVGDTLTVVIPDGTYAGTYYGVWENDPPGFVRCEVNIPGLNNSGVGYCLLSLGCDGAYAQFDTNLGEPEADTIDCGPPSVLTFAGTAFGATGNVTVTT